jgi:hypothetical protein
MHASVVYRPVCLFFFLFSGASRGGAVGDTLDEADVLGVLTDMRAEAIASGSQGAVAAAGSGGGVDAAMQEENGRGVVVEVQAAAPDVSISHPLSISQPSHPQDEVSELRQGGRGGDAGGGGEEVHSGKA